MREFLSATLVVASITALIVYLIFSSWKYRYIVVDEERVRVGPTFFFKFFAVKYRNRLQKYTGYTLYSVEKHYISNL